jgi:hypothetical protein
MKRDTLINILLIIAGILLALALFGAGAVWKGRMKPNRPSVSAPAADKDRSLARKKLNSEESLPVVSRLWYASIAVDRRIR